MSKNKESNRKEKYEDLLRNSFNYIIREQMYLLWSGIFPTYCIAVNLVNFSFVMLAIIKNWILIRRLVDIIIPLVIFTILTIFAMGQFIFLKKWKNEFHEYQKQKYYPKNVPLPVEKQMSRTSLTNIFYSIISYMQNTRTLFILLNLVSIVYLIWGFDFFIIGMSLSLALEGFAKVTWYLNGASVFILLVYMVYQWYHFIKWNKKLVRIKSFEKDIFTELKL
ncbi:MAG: hypothetical protein JW776_11035 [Candidatus Lokiarchaeota archaeon]|nr:hypothetical protein [Candidatus Lokiarchaeota archaeon]